MDRDRAGQRADQDNGYPLPDLLERIPYADPTLWDAMLIGHMDRCWPAWLFEGRDGVAPNIPR